MAHRKSLLRLEADDASSVVTLDKEWFAKYVLDDRSPPVAPRNLGTENPGDDAAEPQIVESDIVFGRMATLVPVLVGASRSKVMVKRVVPGELPQAAEAQDKYEAFIASVEREMHFYRDEVDPAEDLFPRVFASLERVVDGKPAFLLVMEDVTRLSYVHIKSARENWRIEQALAAFARLNSGHRLAACVARCITRGRPPQPGESDEANTLDRERGGFWVLSRRPAAEVLDAELNWAAFLERFCDRIGSTRAQKLAGLGPRLAALAPALQEVARKHSVALIHGDAKSWNLFYPAADRHASVKLIDMQWKGLGHPLQDFVYFMTTSVDTALLRDRGNWRRLLAFFRGLLVAHLDAAHVRSDAARYRDLVLCDSLDAFEDLADVIWLDYVRVVFLGLWRRLDPAQQDANADKIGISLVTSSLDQMLWVLDRAYELIEEAPTRLLASIIQARA